MCSAPLNPVLTLFPSIARKRDQAPIVAGNTWGRGAQATSYPSAASYDTEDVKDEEFSKLKQGHSAGDTKYAVKDTEFSSYPEITQRTVDKLKTKGITSLFPIQ